MNPLDFLQRAPEAALPVLELLRHAPPPLLATGGALLLLLFAFLFFFLGPALRLRSRLRGVLRQLRQRKSQNPADLKKVFEGDPRLLHLWTEFRDTLHAQREERDGQMVTTAWRATAPAESFFNGQYVVDGRLRTEFFKHLPGIFTGIGIIGTFAGLILGLGDFDVSKNPGEVQTGLKKLLDGVTEAFWVSAAAIALAMVVTLVEKVLLASLYRCTEDIAQHLDGLFAMGAGEEYLSRLVIASEDSAAQSRILKDSLVGDLKVLLQEVTDRQIAAQAASSQALGQHITAGIEASLQEPLNRIGEVVAKASGDQSTTAAALLQDVMASFSQRLNELFGGQISGLQELNHKSAQAMQEAVVSLNTLLGRVEENNQRAGDAMAERMVRAIDEMERRQAEINEQTRRMAESIRESVAASQSETHTKLHQALGALGDHVGTLIGTLQAQADQAHQAQQHREQGLAERTTAMVTDLGASVAEVVQQMADSTDQMRQSVTSLERTTTLSIDKLDSGARRLEQGAVSFAQAGDRVTEALGRAGTVADKMADVSGALTTSSSALQAVLSDYRANRDATGTMLTELRMVVESARKEASLTQQALEQIQSAAAHLTQAQQETGTYLEGVSGLLADAHQAFADGLSRTLERANTDFHRKLSGAVDLLHSAIEELEASLSGMLPERV